jgi:hypothetical protein
MRMEHLDYMALSILRKIVIGLPDFSIEQQGVCKGCALGKNAKDMLYVPRIRNSLSVSVLDDRGFVVIFQRGQVLIRP